MIVSDDFDGLISWFSAEEKYMVFDEDSSVVEWQGHPFRVVQTDPRFRPTLKHSHGDEPVVAENPRYLIKTELTTKELQEAFKKAIRR